VPAATRTIRKTARLETRTIGPREQEAWELIREQPGITVAETLSRLSPDEANAWLAANGSNERVRTPATLAEVFAVRAGPTSPPLAVAQSGLLQRPRSARNLVLAAPLSGHPRCPTPPSAAPGRVPVRHLAPVGRAGGTTAVRRAKQP
jgi:hypothetical protein